MWDYSRIALRYGARIGLGLCLLWSGAQTALAQDGPAINPDAPLTYVVKKGDTLWDISGYYLRDPWLWPELWNANEQIENPHLIFPGETLYLVYVDGKPRVQRQPPATIAGGGARDRRSPQVRESALQVAIPTIPINAIRTFLAGPRVIDRDEYNAAPYVVDFVGEHMLGATNVGAYVKRALPENGYDYNLVRIGQKYRDPDSGDVLGYEALAVGKVEINKFDEVSSAQITRSSREVRRGDRLVPPEDDRFEANFFPRAPETAIDGRIIAVYDGVAHIGQFQVVTLNRGADTGLKPGHVLAIFQDGGKVKDPVEWGRTRLPDQLAGSVMVFKTYARISYALVMQATRAIHVRDKVRNPSPTT